MTSRGRDVVSVAPGGTKKANDQIPTLPQAHLGGPETRWLKRNQRCP